MPWSELPRIGEATGMISDQHRRLHSGLGIPLVAGARAVGYKGQIPATAFCAMAFGDIKSTGTNQRGSDSSPKILFFISVI
jgi:hypothetical protein